MTTSRILKRLIIIEAISQGVKIAAVARQLGVSRSWASREANSPEVRAHMADLIAAHQERVGRLLDKALDVIDEAFKAETGIAKGDGTFIMVPDHSVRLETVKVLTSLLVALSPA